MLSLWLTMQRAHGFIRQIHLILFMLGICARLSRTGPGYCQRRTRKLNPSVHVNMITDTASSTLRPGGWIELQELKFVPECEDETMKEDYVVAKFLNLVKEGLAAFGVDLLGMAKNAQYLKDAGFVNVEEKIFKIPLGTWPKNKTLKTIGLYLRSVIYDGLQGVSLGPFTRGLKWTPQEVEVYLIGVRRALMDSSTHAYIPFHVVYGQKPVETG